MSETALQAAERLRALGHGKSARRPLLWLDAALDADGLGTRSLIGVEPAGALFAWGRRLLLVAADGSSRRLLGDPLAALAAGVERLEGRSPRAIGWLGYEIGRTIERLPAPADDFAELPDVAFWFFPEVLERAGPEPVEAELPPPPSAAPLERDFTRAAYLAAVERVRAHILAGDVYQVNLSQSFSGRLAEDPFTLYRRLRRLRPAPLGAYFQLGHRAVLSNSPELFLAVRDGRVESRPIKGTRPRGRDAAEDARLAEELLGSEKDRAELMMIVDLLRNDLGRVAEIGSVTVPSLLRLVTLPTVHHLVATIESRLAAGESIAALLRATLPGGSITGCPKIRAMEIVSALEPGRRGVYCGAIGWIAPGGDLALSVAIRTLSAARGRFRFHAGGGVVLDSDPAAEYAETLAKARAFLEALGTCVDPDEAS